MLGLGHHILVVRDTLSNFCHSCRLNLLGSAVCVVEPYWAIFVMDVKFFNLDLHLNLNLIIR
jgi:hypothetical protein